MVANVGTIDRLMRLALGAVSIVVPFVMSLSALQSSVSQIILVLAGLVLMITAVFRFCPLYRLLGMATCQLQTRN